MLKIKTNFINCKVFINIILLTFNIKIKKKNNSSKKGGWYVFVNAPPYHTKTKFVLLSKNFMTKPCQDSDKDIDNSLKTASSE